MHCDWLTWCPKLYRNLAMLFGIWNFLYIDSHVCAISSYNISLRLFCFCHDAGIGAGFGTGGFGLTSQSPASGRARSCTEAVIVYWLMKQLRSHLEKDHLDKAFHQVTLAHY